MNHEQFINDVRLSTILPADIPSVVARGIDYLNEEHRNWLHLIELATLDVASGDHCIISQLQLGLGDFYTSEEYHQFGLEWCRAHGFHIDPEDMIEYTDLTDEWRRRISELYAEEAASAA